MKKIIAGIFTIMLATTVAEAQKIAADKVPSPVMKTFKIKFPKVTDVVWEMEKAKEYEANFKVNSAEQSATFDNNGVWMETETEIKVSELPQVVQQAVAKQFAGYKIKEASKAENPKHGNCFEVEIQKEKEKLDVLLNAKGEVLSKEADQGDKEDKD